MKSYLFDAFAILCWLQGEKGKDTVSSLLEEATERKVLISMNIINLGEVYYRIAKSKNIKTAEDVLEKIKLLPIKIIPASNELVLEAAKIKAKYPIAYADAFAIITADNLKATIVTGDSDMKYVKDIVNIHWL